MKNDKDLRVIKALFTITLILIGLLVAGFVWYISTDKSATTNTNIQYVGKGEQGLSAYQLAVINGFKGDEVSWLKSLKGNDGVTKVVHENISTTIEIPAPNPKDGNDGKSAYQIWLDLGNEGTQGDFIASLVPKVEDKVTNLRINEITGEIESKLSTDKFWKPIIKCGVTKPC